MATTPVTANNNVNTKATTDNSDTTTTTTTTNMTPLCNVHQPSCQHMQGVCVCVCVCVVRMRDCLSTLISTLNSHELKLLGVLARNVWDLFRR